MTNKEFSQYVGKVIGGFDAKDPSTYQPLMTKWYAHMQANLDVVPPLEETRQVEGFLNGLPVHDFTWKTWAESFISGLNFLLMKETGNKAIPEEVRKQIVREWWSNVRK